MSSALLMGHLHKKREVLLESARKLAGSIGKATVEEMPEYWEEVRSSPEYKEIEAKLFDIHQRRGRATG